MRVLFECEYCGKKFVDEYECQNHERLHIKTDGLMIKAVSYNKKDNPEGMPSHVILVNRNGEETDYQRTVRRKRDRNESNIYL